MTSSRHSRAEGITAMNPCEMCTWPWPHVSAVGQESTALRGYGARSRLS